MKKYEVSIPRKNVAIYEVEAPNKREALRLARKLDASGAENVGVWSGSRVEVKELVDPDALERKLDPDGFFAPGTPAAEILGRSKPKRRKKS